jgi:hypothetical protein
LPASKILARLIAFSVILLALPVLGCSPPNLAELSASEQRALGEAAVARVCGFALDVETPITFEHRYNLAIARQYLDEIVPDDLADRRLSEFFTPDTIRVCAAHLEWGGVNFDVQRLVAQYGTDQEVRALLSSSHPSDADCANFDERSEIFLSACRASGRATEWR